MKTKLITICIFFGIACVGQNNMEVKEVTATETQEEMFTVVEEMPMFPGGQEEMKKFIQKNLEFPKTALEKKVNSKCYIKVIIKPDGSVSGIQVLKGVVDCPECDTEAVRVITMMPKWIPGKQNGRAVSVYYNIPILFSSGK